MVGQGRIQHRRQGGPARQTPGRPKADALKKLIALRPDLDIVKAVSRHGSRGWQSRINAVLREYLQNR